MCIGLGLSLLFAGGLLFAFMAAVPLPNPLFADDYSLVVEDADGGWLRVFLNRKDQWCIPPRESPTAWPSKSHLRPAGAARVPDKLVRAVCVYEDRRFFSHPGIDGKALLRALYQNLAAGRRVSGASTITMQVARIMRPKSRTVANKALEILQALKIELLYEKNEILALYLDHAPYGGNTVGVGAAAYRYFGKTPQALTWAEAALLAVLPNAPGLIGAGRVGRSWPRRVARSGHGQPALLKKRNALMREIAWRESLSSETLTLALQEPLPVGSRAFPFLAPHLAERVRLEHATGSGFGRTTVKPEIQKAVQDLVTYHGRGLARLGIRNAAAVVAETGSGRVRAYVGSQDFHDAAAQGQVDGVTAVRSTGSLLKPFLYALAMDQGLLLPRTLIRDVPSQFGSFSPKNPDFTFHGLVSAREALIRSLNVTAVRVLHSYGLQRFYRYLRSAGLEHLFRSARDYGLPLVLGGAEATLYEMAALYRSLGRGGRASPLTIFESGDALVSGNTPSLISPGACYLTLDMLRGLRRPGAEYYWEIYQDSYPFAWKTGTSFGQKDGWAVGVSPEWTIAVWVGNFTGEGNSNLKSSRCAAPLLFDILNILPRTGDDLWFAFPRQSLQPVRLCAKTGYRAGRDCPDIVYEMAPSSVRPLEVCPYHQALFVSTDGRFRVNSLCWEPGKYERVVKLFFPADVAQYMRQKGKLLERIPPFKPDCAGRSARTPLEIVYPEEKAMIWIPRDLDGQYQRVTLRAAHQEESQTLYWYVDELYRGRTVERHANSLLLPRGRHTLVVIDGRGNRAVRRFYVDLRG